MTWTYDDNPGIATADERRDAVRLIIGDTVTTDQQLTDAQVAFYLTQAGNSASYNTVYAAALQAARALIAKYGRQADYKIGETSLNASQRIKSLKTLVDEIRQYISANAFPTMTGQSISVNQTYTQNTDAVQPPASYGQDFTPGTGPTSTNSVSFPYGYP